MTPTPAKDKTVLAVDMGGSLKTATFMADSDGTGLRLVHDHGTRDRIGLDDLAAELSRRCDGTDAIGIALAGFVDATTGTVCYRHHGAVHDYDFAAIVAAQTGLAVQILNDAEAHLLANHSGLEQAVLAVTVGSSVGVAVTDRHGRLFQTGPRCGVDLGGMRLETSASNPAVWWALGTDGLAELERLLGPERARARYGHRLGSFLGTVAGIFQPNSIVISGGIVASDTNWEAIGPTTNESFRGSVPDWFRRLDLRPHIVRSPYGRHTGLWGAAQRALDPQLGLR